MPSLAPSRPTTVRSTMVEQFRPVLRIHAEIESQCVPAVDVAASRARIAKGQVAYDALRALRSCGDLTPRYLFVLEAFEVAGLISNDDRRSLLDGQLEGSVDVDELVSGWFTGDRTPRDPRRRAARQAAIVVANAVLRAASRQVGGQTTWRGWTRPVCPCCGGSPDLVLTDRATRLLVCARCDAQWRAQRTGCLGCDTDASPAIARISNPALGYDLMMCNACGRFIKERPRRGTESLIVERALTMELDLAAEQRGLRI